MALSMPEFRTRLTSIFQDGKINQQEAKDLAATGLTPEQKTLLTQEIKLDKIENGQKDAVLSALGLSARDVGGGVMDGVVSKAKDKLVDLAKKEIYKPQDFKVADLQIGDHVGLGIRIQTRIVADNDPVVAAEEDELPRPSAVVPSSRVGAATMSSWPRLTRYKASTICRSISSRLTTLGRSLRKTSSTASP